MKSLRNINNLKYLNSGNFFLIAGPCVIESEEIVRETAETIISVCKALEIPFLFKSSYRKANRSKLDSFTGIGDIEGLELMNKLGKEYQIPTITDIHSAHEAELAAKYVDALQIPAFLARQTDILVAAAKTGKPVNIKKGQFMSPDVMIHAVTKVKQSGNSNIILTDRGTMFGYQDLIVDFRGIPTMQKMGYPVVLDITHSLQQPNQCAGVSGGIPEMIDTIAKAGIAVGVDGLFIETHPNPSSAKSDGTNMLNLKDLKPLLERLVKIHRVVKSL
jgi:2-dehydro-3-deoxyphosphooctonate aldolase (KDO 8-P synthase)